MVEATVVLKSGKRETVVLNDFNELSERYENEDVVAISGRVINTKDIRQGRVQG